MRTHVLRLASKARGPSEGTRRKPATDDGADRLGPLGDALLLKSVATVSCEAAQHVLGAWPPLQFVLNPIAGCRQASDDTP